MRIVTAQELERWLANGRVLEADARGPKVVALDNGALLKIFHTRRNRLLAKLQPAAKRFALNARRLHKLGIPAPAVIEVFWLDRSQGLSACIYQPLPGDSVEQMYLQDAAGVVKILPDISAFIRTLHKSGIYFRSLHLGNIIQLPDESFGLIDILDMQFKRSPLSSWLIKRNFDHLRRYLSRKNLKDFPLKALTDMYYQSA